MGRINALLNFELLIALLLIKKNNIHFLFWDGRLYESLEVKNLRDM